MFHCVCPIAPSCVCCCIACVCSLCARVACGWLLDAPRPTDLFDLRSAPLFLHTTRQRHSARRSNENERIERGTLNALLWSMHVCRLQYTEHTPTLSPSSDVRSLPSAAGMHAGLPTRAYGTTKAVRTQ